MARWGESDVVKQASGINLIIEERLGTHHLNFLCEKLRLEVIALTLTSAAKTIPPQAEVKETKVYCTL
jgi:hypothetical protein